MHGMDPSSTTAESFVNDDNHLENDTINGSGDAATLETSGGATAVRIPIVGFEVMDERARFTVFKLRIENEKLGESWLVFRRYTDFVRLHTKLKEEFPGLNIPLPPKRWLRDNFETAFLEDRMKGLQAFVDSMLLVQPTVTESPIVREFFCLDEPPVYPESVEETRALRKLFYILQSMFGTVEDNVVHLRQQLSEKIMEIEILKAELALVTNHRDLVLKTSKNCRNCSQKLSFITSPESDTNGSHELTSSSLPNTTSDPLVASRLRSPSFSDQSISSSSLTSHSNDKSSQSSPKTSPGKDKNARKLNGKIVTVISEDPLVAEKPS